MKHHIDVISITLLLVFLLSGCSKEEILGHKNNYGEATINGMKLYDYVTLEESFSNSLWFRPMPMYNFKITKDSISYIQMVLRNNNEEDYNNYWLILIGLHADTGFPVLNQEYYIIYDDKIDYGNIYSTFLYTRELENRIDSGYDFPSQGIAGLRTPTSDNNFLPLVGKICFNKYDHSTGTYCASYTLESVDTPGMLKYIIDGVFKDKIKIYR